MNLKEYQRYLQKDAVTRAMLDLIRDGKTKALIEVLPLVSHEDQAFILGIFEKLDSGDFHGWHVRKLPQKAIRRRAKVGRPQKSDLIEDAILSFLKIADIKHQEILAGDDQHTPTDTAIIRSICKHEELAKILQFSTLGPSSKRDYLKRARNYEPIDPFAFDKLMLAMAQV